MSLTVNPKVSMAGRTTLKLGGNVVAEVLVHSADGLHELPDTLKKLGGEPLVLGWGSNLLAKDGELDLTLIRLDGQMFSAEPEVLDDSGVSVLVRCGAGVRLPKLVSWAARRGYKGLARLSGIPGTVGGAVAMNAGSYGGEFCTVLRELTMWSPRQGMLELRRGQFSYAYRKFDPGLDAPWCVLGMEMELTRDEPEVVISTMRDTVAKKKATQPVSAATAGCVFKNPEGESAGKLLDLCGYKGRRLGGVGLSDMHANFLVHHGGGTASQALELLDEAAACVRQKFNITLEKEVKVVG